MAYSDKRTRILKGLTYAALALFVLAMLMDFFYVGPERTQGEAQRIFYVHLGSFLGSFLAFGTAVVAGIAYLRSRNTKWDTLGLSSVGSGWALRRSPS